VIFTILLAGAAAAVFAVGTSLQHRAASGVPHEGLSALGLLPRLLRRPGWLLGLVLSGVAFLLHVAALRHGALTLVQPVVVSTIVFAVFVRAGLDRRLPDRKEIAWAICTWAGLTLFISMLEARTPHHRVDPRSEAVFVVSGVLVTLLAVVWAQRTRTATRRGMLLGVAAGILFGLTAGLIKVVITQATFGLSVVLHHWSLLALLVTGINALLLSQRAYQVARLSVIMPILNIVDVLVAISFGAIVFGERLFSSPVHLAGEIVGLVVMAVGVWQLAQHEEGSPISNYYPPPASEP
jgi:hypothetical protein